jgi:hypothetical protein
MVRWVKTAIDTRKGSRIRNMLIMGVRSRSISVAVSEGGRFFTKDGIDI